MRNKKAGRKKGCIPWNKNIPCSKETKRKISEANKGHISWNKGKQYKQIRGKKHYNWKGGIKKDKDGYILIYKPNHPYCDKNNYVPEHRLVVEKQIGCFLDTKHPIHHINSIRSDNRPENLIVFTSDGYHTAFHRWGYYNLKNIIFDGRKIIQ